MYVCMYVGRISPTGTHHSCPEPQSGAGRKLSFSKKDTPRFTEHRKFRNSDQRPSVVAASASPAALARAVGTSRTVDATGWKLVFAQGSHSDSLAYEDLPRHPVGM